MTIADRAVTVAAVYFDGRSSRRQEARLSAQDGVLCIEGGFGQRREPLAAVEVAEPLSQAPRTLRFADGAYCQVADHGALAALLALAGHRDSTVARMQGRWRWALPAMVGVVATVAVIYVWVLPWFSALAAPRIPQAVVQTISDQALRGLDAHLLAPSKLPPERQQQIAYRLAEFNGRLAAQHLSLPAYRLNFRSAPSLGPNAFALPNGDLVLFDELVAMVKDDDELIAVLAHELGHVKYRHGLRQLIQSTVVSSAVGIWLGDISSVAAGLSALVLESRYSRDFEREADAYAAHLLVASGGSVTSLIQALLHLEEKHEATGKKSGNGKESLFSSHPETSERISKLQSLAGAGSR